MSGIFKTTEDELNFILGNDDIDQLLDIDAISMQDDADLTALKLDPPAATAIDAGAIASSTSFAAVGASTVYDNSGMDMKASFGRPNCSPDPQPMRTTNASTIFPQKPTRTLSAKAAKPADNATTPPAKYTSNLKILPSGKDPESRRLRRMMRNRISAKESRDRRNKATEDARRIKAMKEQEIKALEKTVSEEIEQIMLLENTVSFARSYLRPEKFSKVADGQATSSCAAHVVQSG